MFWSLERFSLRLFWGGGASSDSESSIESSASSECSKAAVSSGIFLFLEELVVLSVAPTGFETPCKWICALIKSLNLSKSISFVASTSTLFSSLCARCICSSKVSTLVITVARFVDTEAFLRFSSLMLFV